MIGLVYAGGQSKRFGHDKALFQMSTLPVPNVQLAVNKLRPLCTEVVVCANDKNYQQIMELLMPAKHIHVITDLPDFAQRGPLSAIIACSTKATGIQDYITLAVDYPYITPATIKRLANHPASYISTNDHDHYTLAHFTTSYEQVKSWVLANDDWRLRRFIIEKCNCIPLLCSTTMEFSNLNYNEVDKNER